MRLIDWSSQGLFAQLLPRLVHRDRQMQVLRNAQAEQMLQVYLARSGVQQVCTAHDVCDALECIVNYHRKLVSEQTIRPLYHEVAYFVFKVLGAALLKYVIKLNRFVVRTYSPSPSFATCRNAIATSAGIYRSLNTVQRRIRNLLACATTRICRAIELQLAQRVFISSCALALVENGLIAMQPKCIQSAQYVFCRTCNTARCIKVFHAHQPGAVVIFRIEIAADSGHQRTEVERAGRGGGEAPPVTGIRRGQFLPQTPALPCCPSHPP